MNIRKMKRNLCYLYHSLCRHPRLKPLDTDIDIVIPICEKDLAILPLCLEGVRRNVPHRLAGIYIVAPESEKIRTFCRESGLHFVHEEQVLGYSPKDRKVLIGESKRDRSGWIYQQLLKLAGSVGKSPYFLVIDSDHILLRQHVFITDDKRLVLYQSNEYHRPYYDNIQRLMHWYPQSPLSFVAHKMIFDRKLLARLREEIEQANPGMKWDEAIYHHLNLNDVSGFSEYELYGNYVPEERKVCLPWLQKQLGYSKLNDYDALEKKFCKRYRSITFPAYKKHK